MHALGVCMPWSRMHKENSLILDIHMHARLICMPCLSKNWRSTCLVANLANGAHGIVLD